MVVAQPLRKEAVLLPLHPGTASFREIMGSRSNDESVGMEVEAIFETGTVKVAPA